MVDERDFAILSHLRRDPFASYENLGRGVGLSGRSVRNRLEALEREKVITPLRAVPAAQVFGRQPRLYFFRGSATPTDLSRAVQIDPVVFGTLDVNGKAGILLYCRPGPRGLPDGLETLLGSVSSEQTPLYPYPRRELTKPVSLAELKVLGVLVRGLRTPLKDISESTGLSLRAVKRARKRLLDDGMFQVQPIFQSAESLAIILYELHFHSKDPSVLVRTREAVPRSTFVNQWENGTVILSCWASSIQEVFDVERRVRDEPQIDAAWVKFHARALLQASRLSYWVDEEISRASP